MSFGCNNKNVNRSDNPKQMSMDSRAIERATSDPWSHLTPKMTMQHSFMLVPPPASTRATELFHFNSSTKLVFRLL
ncbi:hypothetical protein Ciccas_012046 [Cichlidogyrus casuarinus]|uniref:Uncharacterized protein n=1 Tax=Cichlidogyrus casuarinus TaxID=1844966 RepID=A0ABD2PPI8_9PLAT